MPFYNFKCEHCSEVEEKLVKMGTEKEICSRCGSKSVKVSSFRTVALGLPNGFAFTRSKSKKTEE